jgi:hypothetical protein
MRKIRKGDDVIVLTGKDRGKRGSVLKIVNAALQERVHSVRLKTEIDALKKQLVAKDHELYLMSTQLKALTEATEILAGRGLQSGVGAVVPSFEDAPNPAHGDVHAWPEEGVPSCDWGGCMREGALARFSVNYGWLPVCETCAKKPV